MMMRSQMLLLQKEDYTAIWWHCQQRRKQSEFGTFLKCRKTLLAVERSGYDGLSVADAAIAGGP